MLSLLQHFTTVIIPLLLALCSESSAKVRPRISGGIEAEQSEFPYIVFINSTWVDNSSIACGGTIVTTKTVLTACQCMLKLVGSMFLFPKITKVYSGDLNLPDNNEKFTLATKYVTHPDCRYSENEAFWINDVGLIKVKAPFKFGDELQPAKFFSQDFEQAAQGLTNLKETGAECQSPGWGLPETNKPRVLKQVNNEFIPLNDCSRTLCGETPQMCFDFSKYSKVLFCVDSLIGSACHGDTGGPFVCSSDEESYVFGVVGTISQCDIAMPLVYAGIIPILEMLNWNYDDEPHDAKKGMTTKTPK